MSVSAQDFRRVMGAFATGVTLVTTVDSQGTAYGLTVNSFTSVSLDPMLILVCLDLRLSGLDVFLQAGKFAVNILSEDQQNVSNHFASRGSEREGWFDAVGKTGVPLLNHSVAHLECRLLETHPAGDHLILIGEVLEAEGGSSEHPPLVFFGGRYRRLEPEPPPEL